MEIDDSVYGRNWEFMATFRMAHPQHKTEFWREFVKKLQIEERLQITLLFAYVSKPLHLHALLSGRSKTGKMLEDVDMVKWQERWATITGIRPRALVIKPVFDAKGAVEYLFSDKNVGGDSGSEVSLYNLKLFRRLNPTLGAVRIV